MFITILESSINMLSNVHCEGRKFVLKIHPKNQLAETACKEHDMLTVSPVGFFVHDKTRLNAHVLFLCS